MASGHSQVDFEAGWATLQKGIDKVVAFIDSNGVVNPNQTVSLFTPDEYSLLYSTVYCLCTQGNYSKESCKRKELYTRYKFVFQDYIYSRVLPSLSGRKGECFLREFVKKWYEHLFMVRCLSRFFFYMDRYFVGQYSLPSMKETGLIVFLDQVYQEMKGEIIGAVLSTINEDRDGKPIDGELVKSVIKILTEFKLNKLDLYQKDFEPAFLDSSAAYYDQKSIIWLRELSHSDYMSKVDECFKIEAFKGSQYLHSNTAQKLIERIRFELIESHADKLARMVNQLELGNKN
ncbi:hypothetical protein LUZ60_011224 [Juncus effusus]|nr:hypothetical protein LUZ60_011224 [Juncus effusus]